MSWVYSLCNKSKFFFTIFPFILNGNQMIHWYSSKIPEDLLGYAHEIRRNAPRIGTEYIAVGASILSILNKIGHSIIVTALAGS
jgi:hypothetical protein